MMNKIVYLFIVLLALLMLTFSASTSVAAVDIFPTCHTNGNVKVCQDVASKPATDPVISIIKAAMEVISFLTGVAAIILIIISGIRFAISNGDANSIASARSTLIYALVGVAVTIAAQAIIVFVLDKIA